MLDSSGSPSLHSLIQLKRSRVPAGRPEVPKSQTLGASATDAAPKTCSSWAGSSPELYPATRPEHPNLEVNCNLRSVTVSRYACTTRLLCQSWCEHAAPTSWAPLQNVGGKGIAETLPNSNIEHAVWS